MPPPPRKYQTYYCRSERDINKHPAQRRAISAAQAPIDIITSLFAPSNHGLLVPAPSTCFSCILPCANVAGGVPVVRVCTGRYAFLVDFVLHLGPLGVFFFANYTRTTVLPIKT